MPFCLRALHVRQSDSVHIILFSCFELLGKFPEQIVLLGKKISNCIVKMHIHVQINLSELIFEMDSEAQLIHDQSLLSLRYLCAHLLY